MYYCLSLLICFILFLFANIIFNIIVKTYIEITKEKIIVIKKNVIIKEIDVSSITGCKYSSIWTVIYNDTLGGYYRIYYKNDEKCEGFLISASKKQASQIDSIIKKRRVV